MEAHGHEEIEAEIAKFLKEIISQKFPDINKQIYSNTLSSNKDYDDIHNALYLGNWLTDFSQLFAPDTLFELKASAADKMKNYNETIESIYCLIEEELNAIDSKIREIIYTGIKYYADGKKFTKDIIKEATLLSKAELNELETEAEAFITLKLKEAGIEKKSTIHEIVDEFKNTYKKEKVAAKKTANELWKDAVDNLNEFEEDAKDFTNTTEDKITQKKNELINYFARSREKIKFPVDLIKALAAKDGKNNLKFEYDKREELWELSFAFLKLMGYKKFVGERGMPFSDFSAVVDNFIEEKTSIQNDALNKMNPNRFRFKLNQYYPSDHLDRAFSSKNLDLFNKQKGYTKKSYFIDNEIAQDSTTLRYTYLDNYIDIAGSKLMQLNKNFILPTFYGIRSSNHNEDPRKNIIVNMAQLGQTLHAVEDFFAHSNFLELSVFFLNNLEHPVLPRSEFYTFDEYIKLLTTDEFRRYTHALLKANSFDQYGLFSLQKDVVETKLATGFYAEGDMATSFYHVAFGGLEKKIEGTEKAGEYTGKAMATVSEYLFPEMYKGVEKYTDTDKIDSIVFFYSELKKLATNKSEFNKIIGKTNNNSEYFSEKVFDYIFKENTSLREKKGWKPFVIDNQEIEYLRVVFNKVINACVKAKLMWQTGKTLKDIWETKDLVWEIFIMAVCVLGILFGGPAAEVFAAELMARFKSLIRELVGEAIYKALEEVLNEILSSIFSKLLNMLGNHVETHYLHRWDRDKQGSHSQLAKDEEYKNKQFNQQAKRAATLVDKAIVLALLTENNVEDKHHPKILDIQQWLSSFLSHPFGNNNPDKPSEANSQQVWQNYLDRKRKLEEVFTLREILIDPMEARINKVIDIYKHLVISSCPPNHWEHATNLFLINNPLLQTTDIQDSSKVTVADAFKRINIQIEPQKPVNKTTYNSENILTIAGSSFNNLNTNAPNDDSSYYRILIPISASADKTSIQIGTQFTIFDTIISFPGDAKHFHWIINLYQKEMNANEQADFIKFVLYAAKMVSESPFLLPLTPPAPSGNTNDEEAQEPTTVLKKFFEFYNLGEPNLQYLSVQEAQKQITDGVIKELNVKVTFEEFLNQYYEKYYGANQKKKK